jgi:ribonuclease BN (tRNA processing enzyme)
MFIDLICLGVGAGQSMVYQGHCSSAFVVRVNRQPVLLIDIGFGVVRQCLAQVQSIPRYIYITHNHGDHAAELPICAAVEKHVTVVAQVSDRCSVNGVDARYFKEQVAEQLQTHRMSEMVGAPIDVTWHKCQAGVRSEVSRELSITVHHAQHSQVCYGCVLYYQGQPLVALSGDSGYSESLYRALQHAPLVFIDGRARASPDHASYDQIRQFIAQHWPSRADSVWIYHHDEHVTEHVTGLQLVRPGQCFVLYSDE